MFIERESLYFVYFPKMSHAAWVPFSRKEYAQEYYNTWNNSHSDYENAMVLDWNMAISIKGDEFMNKLYNDIVDHDCIYGRLLYQCSSSCLEHNHYDTCIEKHRPTHS
jgi:hypothetical protein